MRKWRALAKEDRASPSRWPEYDPDVIARELTTIAMDLERELQPAGVAAIRRCFERLSSTYAAQRADDESAEDRARNWLDAFKAWPMFALRGALDAWLTRDTAFMPTTGQFFAIGRPLIESKRALQEDIRTVLNAREEQVEKESLDKDVDPEISRKLKRLVSALKSGEDIAALRASGVL